MTIDVIEKRLKELMAELATLALKAENYTRYKQVLKDHPIWECFTVDGELIEAAYSAEYPSLLATRDGRVFRDMSFNNTQKKRAGHQFFELNTWINKQGYVMVSYFTDGKNKNARVHRVVADAFLVKPGSGTNLQINHIDLNKQNNKVSNLEWNTQQENIDHFHAVKEELRHA